jgi:prephenate dehydrogenase
MSPAPVSRLLVVGTGLIGTSLGLALRDMADVVLEDSDDEHLAAAVRRGAGRAWDGAEAVDLAVVCTPPRVTAEVVASLLRRDVAQTVSQVSSVQSQVQRDLEALLRPGERARTCGGHPMAGRELRGPGAASGRLFLDRPWVVCPSVDTSVEARAHVVWLARAVGAEPVELTAEAHDAAVALVSHLPQVAASAVAARLTEAVPAAEGQAVGPLRLAGPGLQDTTRIAGSDDTLWTEVLAGNAGQVAPLVRRLATDLDAVAAALERLAVERSDSALAEVRGLLRRGRAGRAALPAKAGVADLDLVPVVVSVPDRPGQLAGVLQSAADAGVNVEDVRVEHLPGRPRGLLELLVASTSAAEARAALSRAGWEVVAG